MKRVVWLLCAAVTLAGATDFPAIRTVYLLPMNRGMDQFLANRLTNDHVFQVVADPKLADAVFTDRLGETFEAQLDNLFPAPPEPKPAAAAKPDSQKADQPQSPGLPTNTVNKLDNPAANSSFGRGRGNIFLVDVGSRRVLWSSWEQPRSSQSRDLDRTASEYVERLKRALGMKK